MPKPHLAGLEWSTWWFRVCTSVYTQVPNLMSHQDWEPLRSTSLWLPSWSQLALPGPLCPSHSSFSPLDGSNSRLITLSYGSQGGQAGHHDLRKCWHTQIRNHMYDFSGYWHERHTRQSMKNLATRKTRPLGLLRWVWLFINVFKVIWVYMGVEMYPLNED